MLKSVSSIRRRHAGHDGEVFLWPYGPHCETRRKNKLPLLWLGKRPSAVVLVGRHDAGSPCRPESVADVVDNRQDVASVFSNWPAGAIARGFEIPSIQQNLLSVPAAV